MTEPKPEDVVREWIAGRWIDEMAECDEPLAALDRLVRERDEALAKVREYEDHPPGIGDVDIQRVFAERDQARAECELWKSAAVTRGEAYDEASRALERSVPEVRHQALEEATQARAELERLNADHTESEKALIDDVNKYVDECERQERASDDLFAEVCRLRAAIRDAREKIEFALGNSRLRVADYVWAAADARRLAAWELTVENLMAARAALEERP